MNAATAAAAGRTGKLIVGAELVRETTERKTRYLASAIKGALRGCLFTGSGSLRLWEKLQSNQVLGFSCGLHYMDDEKNIGWKSRRPNPQHWYFFQTFFFWGSFTFQLGYSLAEESLYGGGFFLGVRIE